MYVAVSEFCSFSRGQSHEARNCRAYRGLTMVEEAHAEIFASGVVPLFFYAARVNRFSHRKSRGVPSGTPFDSLSSNNKGKQPRAGQGRFPLCRGGESNTRRKVLQTFALPLSYRGKPSFISASVRNASSILLRFLLRNKILSFRYIAEAINPLSLLT